MWGLISVPCGEVIIAMRARSTVVSLVTDRVGLEGKVGCRGGTKVRSKLDVVSLRPNDLRD